MRVLNVHNHNYTWEVFSLHTYELLCYYRYVLMYLSRISNRKRLCSNTLPSQLSINKLANIVCVLMFHRFLFYHFKFHMNLTFKPKQEKILKRMYKHCQYFSKKNTPYTYIIYQYNVSIIQKHFVVKFQAKFKLRRTIEIWLAFFVKKIQGTPPNDQYDGP